MSFAASLPKKLINEIYTKYGSCDVDMTVGFIDLVGYTDMLEYQGRIFANNVLEIYYRAITDVLSTYFSYSAKVIGDMGLLVIKSHLTHEQVVCLCKAVVKQVRQSVPQCNGMIEVQMGVCLKHAEHSIENAINKARRQLKDAKRNKLDHISFIHSFEENNPFPVKLAVETRFNQRKLCLYLQPKVSIETHSVTGFECLLRCHNDNGVSSPEVFLQHVDMTNMHWQLAEFVINEAVQCLIQLDRVGFKGTVSFNMAVNELRSFDVVSVVSDLLKDRESLISRLEVEITETQCLYSDPESLQRINNIHKRGIKIAIDDFGTGYSNLRALQTIPFNSIKGDKTLIDGVTKSEMSRCLLRSVALICTEMNIPLVMEGVETSRQLAYCQEIGIDIIQGFHYARPMPLSEALKYKIPSGGINETVIV